MSTYVIYLYILCNSILVLNLTCLHTSQHEIFVFAYLFMLYTNISAVIHCENAIARV